MANNTSDDELRTFIIENISHESAGCPYSKLTNIAKTSMDRLVDDILLPFIKQREEQVAREARRTAKIENVRDFSAVVKAFNEALAAGFDAPSVSTLRMVLNGADARATYVDLPVQLTPTHKGDK